MDIKAAQPNFPFSKAIASLLGVLLLIAAVAWWITPSLTDSPAIAHQAILLSMAVVGLTSVVCIIPVTILGPMGVMPTVYGYFIGMGIRMATCLLAIILFQRQLELPRMLLGITMAIFYLPILAIEVAFVAKYLWQKDFLNKPTATNQSPTASEVIA